MPLTVENREAVIDLMIKLKPSHVIARELNLKLSDVIDTMQEYQAQFDDKVKANPDLLNRKLEHIFKALETYEKVKQESWRMFETTDEANSNARAKYLKLVMDSESNKADMLQLVGGNQDAAARLSMAEAAQTQLVGIIKQVLSGCPKCATAFRQALQANRMMITTSVSEVETVG